jgi:outer membrane protein assembly factor BamB
VKTINIFLFLVILIACTGVSTSEAVTYTPQTYWKIDTDSRIDTSPVYSSGTVYFNNKYQQTFAVNADTGNIDWIYESGASTSSPAFYNNKLYVTGRDVYALNASSGNLVWSCDISLDSTPTIYDNILYASGSKIYAIDATTGTLRWNYDAVSESTPTAFNGVIYVGLNDGNISALNADTGSLLWNYQTGGMVKSSPTVVNNVLYVGSQDKSIYALNASTGNLIWKYSTGGIVDSSPIVSKNKLYIGSADNSIYALDATNGQLEWKFQTDGEVVSSPAVVNETVFIGSKDAYLYALNASNGALEWKYRTGYEILSSPISFDGIVYVGSADHYFYAIGGNSGITDSENPYFFYDKMTLRCGGETLELKEGYNLTAVAIDSEGDKAILNLTKNGEALDEQIISVGDHYYYNRSLNDSNRIIIDWELTQVFQGQVDSLVVIENFLQYPEIESSDTNPTKLLKINEPWEIGNNYSFNFTEIGSLGNKVLCSLQRDNDVVKTCILGENELFVYERKNSTTEDIATIFETPILKIFHSSYGDYLQISQNYSINSDIDTADINQSVVVECSNSINLDDGYDIKVDVVSPNSKALLSLSKNGIIVDQHIVEENDTYQYGRLNDSNEIDIILELNVERILYCDSTGYISFSPNYQQIPDVNTTSLPGNVMIVKEAWNIGNGYALEAKQISVDGDKVWMMITKEGNFVEDEILVKGETFEYISPQWGQIGQDWFKFNGTISNALRGSGIYGYVEIGPYYTINSNVSYQMDEDDIKVLGQSDVWTVNGYTLTANEVNISNNSVLLKLDFEGETINEKWLSIDEKFEYNISAYSNDLLLYSVNVNNISSGTNSNFVQLSELLIYDLDIDASDKVGTSVVISPDITLFTSGTSKTPASTAKTQGFSFLHLQNIQTIKSNYPIL